MNIPKGSVNEITLCHAKSGVSYSQLFRRCSGTICGRIGEQWKLPVQLYFLIATTISAVQRRGMFPLGIACINIANVGMAFKCFHIINTNRSMSQTFSCIVTYVTHFSISGAGLLQLRAGYLRTSEVYVWRVHESQHRLNRQEPCCCRWHD